MEKYYKERAPIYDKVYLYPEREKDIKFLKEYIPSRFKGLDIIEIAAGTGYWTQYVSATAKTILATDAVEEPLEELKRRRLPDSVSIVKQDAYSLDSIDQLFNGAFAGLWLSHVPKQKIKMFFIGLHRLLEPGSKVIFIDNSKSQCIRFPITRKDKFGNGYQERTLDNGSAHEVLKNFPSEMELNGYLINIAENINYIELEHFWLIEYRKK
ncbi:MAG: SAM-dependent methyltransferase [SAR86 cluster bacterium]|uniref:SAM-dependent methyltransferase n=1 Tax=SAR86 cluster bacterium TaxID=2030880 RepID=A0A2A5CGM2_9GAMM|nr:MAG: SAM-dependent methyltransferase [SAR86 cluster bacterium]